MNNLKNRTQFVKTTNGSPLNFSMVAQVLKTPRGLVVLDKSNRIVDWREHDKYDTAQMWAHYSKAIRTYRKKDFLILNDESAITWDCFAYLHESQEGIYVINTNNDSIYLISAERFTALKEVTEEINTVIDKLSKGRYAQVNWEKYRKPESMAD